MKEEILKALDELPKVKVDNPISTMNGINVNDLMDAVERFDKVPTYQQLLDENKSLQSQLKAKEEKVRKLEKYVLEDDWSSVNGEIASKLILNKMEELEILSKGENK